MRFTSIFFASLLHMTTAAPMPPEFIHHVTAAEMMPPFHGSVMLVSTRPNPNPHPQHVESHPDIQSQHDGPNPNPHSQHVEPHPSQHQPPGQPLNNSIFQRVRHHNKLRYYNTALKKAKKDASYADGRYQQSLARGDHNSAGEHYNTMWQKQKEAKGHLGKVNKYRTKLGKEPISDDIHVVPSPRPSAELGAFGFPVAN